MDCSLVKTSCGQVVPSVVPLTAYGLVVPLVVTLTVLIVHSCLGCIRLEMYLSLSLYDTITSSYLINVFFLDISL